VGVNACMNASQRPCQSVPIPFTILEISYFCCQTNLNRITQPTHSFSVYEVVHSVRFHNQNHVLVRQRTHSPYLIIHVIILSISHRVLVDNVSVYIDILPFIPLVLCVEFFMYITHSLKARPRNIYYQFSPIKFHEETVKKNDLREN
jgi:hypothetical protein